MNNQRVTGLLLLILMLSGSMAVQGLHMVQESIDSPEVATSSFLPSHTTDSASWSIDSYPESIVGILANPLTTVLSFEHSEESGSGGTASGSFTNKKFITRQLVSERFARIFAVKLLIYPFHSHW